MRVNQNKISITDAVIILFITLSTLICIVPLLYIISLSTSSELAIYSNMVTIYPIGFNLESFRVILADRSIMRSLLFSMQLTVMSTALSMFLTICAAYPLTKTRLKGRKFFFIVIIVTMYFSGGIIPDFILVRSLNLLDTIWVLILPSAISSFNVIILKTFFSSSIPQSLEESAYLDGCNDLMILIRIVLPLSTPVLACLSLFYAVGRWNGFQDVLFYITNSKLYTMQLKLYQLVYNNQTIEVSMLENVSAAIPTQGLKAACIVVATIPILVMYPWLQRYFTAGITIGAIKE